MRQKQFKNLKLQKLPLKLLLLHLSKTRALQPKQLLLQSQKRKLPARLRAKSPLEREELLVRLKIPKKNHLKKPRLHKRKIRVRKMKLFRQKAMYKLHLARAILRLIAADRLKTHRPVLRLMKWQKSKELQEIMLLAILQLRKALRTRALPKKYRRASSATEKPATKILRMQMITMAFRASNAISRKTIIRKMPLNKKAVISVLVALISKTGVS